MESSGEAKMPLITLTFQQKKEEKHTSDTTLIGLSI